MKFSFTTDSSAPANLTVSFLGVAALNSVIPFFTTISLEALIVFVPTFAVAVIVALPALTLLTTPASTVAIASSLDV